MFSSRPIFSHSFASVGQMLGRNDSSDDDYDPQLRTILETLHGSRLTDDFDPMDITTPRIRDALVRQALASSHRTTRSGATRRTPEWVSHTLSSLVTFSRREDESQDDIQMLMKLNP